MEFSETFIQNIRNAVAEQPLMLHQKFGVIRLKNLQIVKTRGFAHEEDVYLHFEKMTPQRRMTAARRSLTLYCQLMVIVSSGGHPATPDAPTFIFCKAPVRPTYWDITFGRCCPDYGCISKVIYNHHTSATTRRQMGSRLHLCNVRSKH